MGPLAAIALPLLAGCSLSTLDVAPCTDDARCRDRFGLGSTCGASGYCEAADIPERCQRSTPEDLLSDPAAYPELILLGSLFDEQSFPLEVQAIELAVFQANDSGGLGGATVGVVHCTNQEDSSLDDLSQDEANAAAATLLVDTLGVPALLGPATSARAEAAFLAVQDAQALLISPSATSPALTELDGGAHSDEDPGLFWRTAPPDDLQAAVIAADIAGRTDEVAIIFRADTYGQGLVDAFDLAWGQGAAHFSYDTDTQLIDAVTSVGAGEAREVLFISSEKADILAFLNAAATLEGYEDLGIFLTDGAYDTSLLAELGGAAHLFDQIRGTRPAPPAGEVYDAFAAAFAAAYQGAAAGGSGFTAHAYDAGWLAIYGAAWSTLQEGGLSGLGMARGLRRVSEGSSVAVRASSWGLVQDTFERGEGVDVIGASGPLDYDPITGETQGPIDVWAVDEDGEGFVVLYTVEP